jgi:UDP-N-acetylglucosamine transferase subunit ALG13
MMHNFDPYTAMEQLANNQTQLDNNQKNIVVAVNQVQQVLNDHDSRLALNLGTINQILVSLQNQQKLLMTMFDQLQKVQQVNIPEDPKQ